MPTWSDLECCPCDDDVVGDGCTTCWDCCAYNLAPPDELYFTWGDFECETIGAGDPLPCDLANGSPTNEVVFTYDNTPDPVFLRDGTGLNGYILCADPNDGLVHMFVAAPGWDFGDPSVHLHYAIPLEDWRCEGPNEFFLVEIPPAVSPYNSYATSITVHWRLG